MDYGGNIFVTKDLKRLKTIRSLESDVQAHFQIFKGKMEEGVPSGWPHNTGIADYLCERVVAGKTLYFFKARQKTVNPRSGTSDGIRILFCVDSALNKYIPFLVFRASEEGTKYCCPDQTLYPLTHAGFKQIIAKKLECLAADSEML